jgi:hypothetical protein
MDMLNFVWAVRSSEGQTTSLGELNSFDMTPKMVCDLLGRVGAIGIRIIANRRAAVVGGHRHRSAVAAIQGPGLGGEADLSEVVGAADAFGASQGRQQHGRQNGDDGDDDQQFDEREPAPG